MRDRELNQRSRAAALLSHIAEEDISNIDEDLRHQLSAEHLDPILRRLGLPPDMYERALQVAAFIRKYSSSSGLLYEIPAPSDIKKELKKIEAATRKLKTLLESASRAARFECTSFEIEYEVDETPFDVFGEDPFEEALPTLHRLLDVLENVDIQTGPAGRLKSAKHLGLMALRSMIEGHCGDCSKDQFTELANEILDAALDEDDLTRRRDLISEVLKNY